MSAQQRFCPICNRAFQEAEAVLRCEGCSVLHHPGCWVTNGGCATQADHRVTPAAMAYPHSDRPGGTPAPHPGEVASAPPPATSEPIPFRPASRSPEGTSDPDDPLVIGSAEIRPMVHRTLPSTVGVPSVPRRYQPPPGEQMPRRQMPKIYGGHPLLAYWYVPAAVGLAIFVAFAVIWTVGRLTGEDDAATPQRPPRRQQAPPCPRNPTPRQARAPPRPRRHRLPLRPAPVPASSREAISSPSPGPGSVSMSV
ncbi:MAG: hypothetical protein IPI33_14305 [Dehalococcoidia bacterium]|nr:hypothetical protein [Dehalococcoidia bacterium]